MVSLHRERQKWRYTVPTIALGTVLVIGLPLAAQPGSPDQPAQEGNQTPHEQKPAAILQSTTATLPSESRMVSPDLHDPVQLQTAVENALLYMDFQDKLSTKISILVRNATLQDLANAVRVAGFTIPIEVRKAPLIPITLGVRSVAVKNVLTAATVLTTTDFFVFPDHLLITRPEFLTRSESQAINILRNGRYMAALELGIGQEMKQLGKEHMALGELSATMQQVVQHIYNDHCDEMGKPRLKLTPDAIFNCKYELVRGLDTYTMSLNWSSARPDFTLKCIDMSKRHNQN